MDDQIEIRRRLDACEYAYIAAFIEGERSFSLRVEVIEARADHPQKAPQPALDESATTYDKVSDTILRGSVAIAPAPGCAHFTLFFENYLMFAVRDETYAKPEKHEDYSRKLREYSSSALLDYVEKSSYANPDIVGPIRHLAVVCLDRIVDVICSRDPIISMRITESSEYHTDG